MQRARRRGMSLIEVVIAIMIVALLVGLLLPAVHVVRESAVRLKSANRLRQIAIATQNYAVAHAGSLPGFDRSSSGREGPGTFEPILPFLEAETTITPNPNHPSRWEYVPGYVSPADSSFTNPLHGPGLAPGTYIYIAGDHSYPANWQALRVGATVTRSFSDGTSTTIAFAERYARCSETATWWVLTFDRCRDPSNNNAYLPYCSNPSLRRPTFADPDYDDVQPVTVNGITVPSVVGSTFQVAPTLSACDYRVPQTPHLNGLLVAYVDGSVRTIRSGVSPEVFWSAITPSGGERALE